MVAHSSGELLQDIAASVKGTCETCLTRQHRVFNEIAEITTVLLD